jgi:glycosyltransferase involved in cell wall biosynthesis
MHSQNSITASNSASRRIAVLVPTLETGGVERVAVELAHGLHGIGCAVDLVAGNGNGALRPGINDSIRVFDLKASRMLTALPAFCRYLRNERPQAVIAAMTHSSLVALWARGITRVRTRIIATEHTTLSTILANRPLTRVKTMPALARIFFRYANAVVAVSNGVADDFAVLSGIPRERIQVIYNPVISPERMRRAAEPIDHPWFAPGQPPVILGVGRLVVEKDFGTLIRAFAELRNRLPSRLLIIGEGPERSRLEQLVNELGLEDAASLPGANSNPLAYMRRAALLTMSSRWEGLPLVPIEALAAGCPVVSTDCKSGPREILQGGKYGRLVPVGDINAMADAMFETLNEPRRVIPPEALLPFQAETVARQYASLAFEDYPQVSSHAAHALQR